MLTLGDGRLMLEELTTESHAHNVGTIEKPFGRGMHFQIKVKDVQALYDTFKKENYPVFMDMEEKWYRMDTEEKGHKQFRVLDPDGYQLRFYESLGERSVA